MKLHLGSGSVSLPGFVNIDIVKHPGVDVIADISNLPYEEESIDEIYACAVLDHFGRHEWIGVLRHWHFLLKRGGCLRISVTDFEAVCREYLENLDVSSLLGLVVGGHRDQYDRHGMIFDFNYLRDALDKVGFKDIGRYDWRDYYVGVDDYSRAYLPHMDFETGRLMVLNMEAIKC